MTITEMENFSTRRNVLLIFLVSVCYGFIVVPEKRYMEVLTPRT